MLLKHAGAHLDVDSALSEAPVAEAEPDKVVGHADPDSISSPQHAAQSTAIALNKEPASSAAPALSPAPAMLQSHLVAVAAQMPTLR